MRDFKNLEYNVGFNNHFESESIKDSLPKNQNNPQKNNYGLYTEQLSGSAFTAPKNENKRSWLYKIRPSISQNPLEELENFNNNLIGNYDEDKNGKVVAKQLRWKPMNRINKEKFGKQKITFCEGIFSFCGTGNPLNKKGVSIYGYWCNESMNKQVFYSADGDFLIVPQKGTLKVISEFGKLLVEPHEIIIIPRGIKYSIEIDEESSGWISEIFNGHFELPERGPIGSNGLANERDFLIPKAFYEDSKEKDFTIISKFGGTFFISKDNYSPFDIVAWHGNYYPYKYDLRKFNTMGTVSYDHPDPSILTVLTCQSEIKGTALLDFVIFPPRYMVAENTFRPPYYHRNIMSEFMGNISGTYDAKEEGFSPGSSSLHSMMTPHGPEKIVFEKASNEKLAPVKYENTMSFMFETSLFLKINKKVIGKDGLCEEDVNYCNCWKNIDSNFKIN